MFFKINYVDFIHDEVDREFIKKFVRIFFNKNFQLSDKISLCPLDEETRYEVFATDDGMLTNKSMNLNNLY